MRFWLAAPPPADAATVDRWHAAACDIEADARGLADLGRLDLAADLEDVAAALRAVARRYARGAASRDR